MSITQIIEAIEQGDASSVTALFDKLMASKLEEAIEEKKQELSESLFTEEELTEAYTAKGKVTHAGQVHSFGVKYDDFPDHKDVEEQNPHLSKHHVEAVMRHFESHGDDDMTGTHSTHQGAKVHMTHNGGHMDESVVNELAEDFEQLDELSKKTLGNYLMKVHQNVGDLSKKKSDNAHAQQKAMDLDYGGDREAAKHISPVRDALRKSGKKIDDTLSKRSFGSYRAIRNLTKEDVEAFFESEEFQALDEVSGKLLGSYVQKAHADRQKHYDNAEVTRTHPKTVEARNKFLERGQSDRVNRARYTKLVDTEKKHDPAFPKSSSLLANKRGLGIQKAVKKLTSGKLSD